MGNSTKQVIKILYSVILCREFHENEYVNVKTAKNWGFCSKQCEASYGLFPARLQETKISFLSDKDCEVLQEDIDAASVAGMILTTECALIDIKEDAPAGGGMPPMGGGMPGMM